MANATTQLPSTPAARGLFGRIGAAFVRWIEAYDAATSRRDQIEALEAMSDAELAAMGLPRDEIPRHVFRDLFYT